ncbi:MAG: ribosome biogenesis GTP-binding protein YihA/YsxC [Flavobacteriales bacterium]
MIIKTAEFLVSNSDPKRCPKPDKPEYAFIGRSNVGKSSLINKLVNRKGLAKTSGRPGKTQLINHFLVNEEWYLVDLPGYGYAKVSKSQRSDFSKLITNYIATRTNLINLFVLIDVRLPLQSNDLNFINWLGENGVPFVLVFTKSDKLGSSTLQQNIAAFKRDLLKYWESMPSYYISSAESGLGRDEILAFIEDNNRDFKSQFVAQPL